MRKWLSLFVWLSSWSEFVYGQENLARYFHHLSKLEFTEAKKVAALEEDSLLRFETVQLAEILFYEGQLARANFELYDEKSHDEQNIELSFIRALNAGYVSLFYDRTKENAYKYFYYAYQVSKKLNNPVLIKASLLAFFRYHNYEIAQISDSYKNHLDHFESLKEDYIDEVWLTIYKIIYYTKLPKSLGGLDDRYYKLSKSLDEFEQRLDPKSPALAYIYYEKAIKFDHEKDVENSEKYSKKVIDQAKGYPFLKDKRFFSLIKLMNLEIEKKRFTIAKSYLARAREETNLADTLRSKYYLNIYGSLFYRAQNKNDSAFDLLKRAYLQEFELDFRKNTLEINRLNIELETQEKENANLQLKQNRIWLVSALAGVALLFVASYLAFTNQRSKNKIQSKEKEVQAMKLEKVLKDQEIFGIDAMLEGQEKERQRMADDLHDNLGSDLATLNLYFEDIKERKEVVVLDQNGMIQNMEDLLKKTYQKVRSMAHAGNAGVNAQEGLLPAVKNFASKVSILNRLMIDVEDHGMNSRLENSLEITIFRIIQELITNIIKHSQASEVVIHLTNYEDTINLMVEDNGIGFDLSQVKPSGGMGLHSIQKKIENLGGRVTIESIAHKGTTVIIDVPLT